MKDGICAEQVSGIGISVYLLTFLVYLLFLLSGTGFSVLEHTNYFMSSGYSFQLAGINNDMLPTSSLSFLTFIAGGYGNRRFVPCRFASSWKCLHFPQGIVLLGKARKNKVYATDVRHRLKAFGTRGWALASQSTCTLRRTCTVNASFRGGLGRFGTHFDSLGICTAAFISSWRAGCQSHYQSHAHAS